MKKIFFVVNNNKEFDFKELIRKYLSKVSVDVGKSLPKNSEKYDNINGISISPKKEFNIIKIWFKCKIKNIDNILNIDDKYINSKNSMIKNN